MRCFLSLTTLLVLTASVAVAQTVEAPTRVPASPTVPGVASTTMAPSTDAPASPGVTAPSLPVVVSPPIAPAIPMTVTRPGVPVTSGCTSGADVATAERDTRAFMERNAGAFRESDRARVDEMLERVLEPVRRGARDCTPPARVEAQTREEFQRLHDSVGPGGRMLFDELRVPMTGGTWREVGPPTTR